MILHGDCLELMPTLDRDSVDAVVTDPPYGLGFMGKHWDHGVPNVDFWREMYRVLKPGGHLLSFGGTRTVHRIAANIEDAGFEIRDMLMWIYASGFPKSLNLGNGWGTALKPAHEPIVMARKPLQGTVAGNVARYGTGALNIEGCRIGTEDRYNAPAASNDGPTPYGPPRNDEHPGTAVVGRWPSNILLSDPELFDQPNPYVVGSGATAPSNGVYRNPDEPANVGERGGTGGGFLGGHWTKRSNAYAGEVGGYSRFFIIPKASRAERERGLAGAPTGKVGGRNRADGRQWDIPGSTIANGKRDRANTHPTVKPLDLMRHLVRLVTPPGGTVLDPFLGSGTTAIACELEGFQWIGMEREAEYVAIAEGRILAVPRGLGL